MRLAAVESAALEDRAGLDQQHGLAGVIQEVRAQLIGEAPAAGVPTHGASETWFTRGIRIVDELVTLHVLPGAVRAQPWAIGNAAFIPPSRAV
jgi:hypothetical protein